MTIKQQKTLDWIRGYITTNGYPPTIREIAAGLGLYYGGVMYRLQQLEASGAIRRKPGIPRSIVVTAGGESVK